MIFTETKLAGAFAIELQKIEDERGFFARSWCKKEFHAHGLDGNIVQANVSFNKQSGTLRGMHYQAPPFAEAKIVSCIKGSIYDVIVDLRQGSPTFLQWFGLTLSASNRTALYVPKSFAHGFQAMEDESEVSYLMSEFYSQEHARGFRWDDPLFCIEWPMIPSMVSARDRGYRDARPEDFAELTA